MRIRRSLIVVVAVALISAGFLVGRTVEKKGTPDSSSAPGVTSSYTLEDIYNRLDTGAPGSSSLFTEPIAGPGTATMHTLDDIMALIPDLGSNVAGGDGEIWFGIPDGIYRTKKATAQDSDLKAEDIRDGVQIFDVTGTNLTCVQCTGTLDGTRWCDNEDNGTVTDMTTGLVWLKKADWGGQKPWEDCTNHDDAHTRAGLLYAGATGAGLSDGSDGGDWRLPTADELYGLTEGAEGVSSTTPRAFTGVKSTWYWSSSTSVPMDKAHMVDLHNGDFGSISKLNSFYVWPVRGP